MRARDDKRGGTEERKRTGAVFTKGHVVLLPFFSNPAAIFRFFQSHRAQLSVEDFVRGRKQKGDDPLN